MIRRKFNLPPYLLSEIKDNPNLRDEDPRDIHPMFKPLMKPGEAKPKICFDTLMEKEHILTFTRPDLRMLIFDLTDFAKEIRIEWIEDRMSVEIMYAYSIDGHTWSRFYEHDEYEKFLSLVSEAYGKQFDVSVKLRIETFLEDEGTENYSVHEEPYFVLIDKVLLNGKDVKIKSVVVTNARGFALPQQKQLFDPYANMDNAVRIWEQSSKAINHMFGHWAYYFKTDPNDDTRNITLKSYQLHNVVEMKKIKISIPDNEFPSMRNVYSEWGFALPDEFQCHILVDVFETAFGKGEFPHTHDYVYFPITGAMYNVNAYNPANDFMYKMLWWECQLVKYEDDKTVIKNEFEEDTIQYNELTPDVEMQELYQEEIEEADPTYLNIKLLEAFREKLSKSCEIVEYPIYVDRLKLNDNMYLCSGVELNDIAVQFDTKHTPLSNVNLSFWLMLERRTPTRKIINLTNAKQENIFDVTCAKGILKVNYGTDRKSTIATEKELETDVLYGISINLSLMYQYMEFYIIKYDSTNGTIEKEFLEHQKCDVALTKYDFDKIQIMGGKHLVGQIGLYKMTYTETDIPKILTQVTPDSEECVFFDKAHLPMTENAINGY